MRRLLIVTGILGTGTALVFAVAVLAATMFPTGSMVYGNWNGGWAKGGIAVPMPAPVVVDDTPVNVTPVAPGLSQDGTTVAPGLEIATPAN